MDWLPNEDGMTYFCREILPKIRQAEPEATLSIIGRAPTPAVRRLAEIPGVEVTGRVDDVRPHIARGAVYVVPLRIGGGTRLKIFEAMSMAKAVVSTTVGAEGLPVTSGRDIEIADEPARFAHAVVHLMRDTEARRAIGGRGAPAGRRALRLVGGGAGFRSGAAASRRSGRAVARANERAIARCRPSLHTGGPDRNNESVSVRSGIRRQRLGGVASRQTATRSSASTSTPAKVASLNEGRSPIVEKGLDELIRDNTANGRLRATTSTAEAVRDTELSLICVGTPSRKNGSLDLTYLERVAEQIGEALKDKDELPRRRRPQHGAAGDDARRRDSGARADVGQEVRHRLRRHGEPRVPARGHRDPRLPPSAADAGRPQLPVATPSRPRRSTRKVEAPMETTTIRTAEMMKYASNTWHALKVTFANEIGNVCKRVGIDSHEVMNIFCKDEKLNLSSYYMKPGFAFGGSCLPKDVRALQYRAKEVDLDMPVIQAILGSNQLQIQHAIDEIVDTGKKRVGLLGFSFKAGTDDLRESPIVILAEALLGKGFQLCIYDKNVSLARLVGANKDYINKQIPHLSSLLSEIDRRGARQVRRHRRRQRRAGVRRRADAHARRPDHPRSGPGQDRPREQIPRADYRGICW